MKPIDNKLEDEQTHFKQLSTPLQQSTQNPSPPPSPNHEFSFTVSIQPLTSPITTQHHHSNTNCHTIANNNNNHKTDTTTNTTTLQPPSPPPAIDLTPADDIFLHGHLLPLHPLPHPPNDSPRSSTNSMDSFTLPINLLYHPSNPIGTTSFHCHHHTTFSDSDDSDNHEVTPTPPNPTKTKPFSIFNIPKWKKRSDDETEPHEDQPKQTTTKKLKLDLSQLVKRYMKMVKPLLSFPKSRRSNRSFNNHQSYSYSSNSLSRKQPIHTMNRGCKRRGMLSAPASMRASPANSGVLLASGFVSPAKSTSESSMEELHAAIQAAIAHCKNSIDIEDKVII